MSDHEAKQATPHSQLIAEIMDSRVPKNEREWAAKDEIERLRRELAEAREALRRARPHLRNRQIDFEICRPSQGDTGQLQKWRNDIGEILARINAFLGEQK